MSVVSPAGHELERGPAPRQRPARRDGLRDSRQGAPAAQRGEPVGRLSRRGVAAGFSQAPRRGPPPAVRRQERRGAGLWGRTSDRHADFVPLLRTARRLVARFRGGGKRDRLPARTHPRRRHGPRDLPPGRRHAHARGVHLRARQRAGGAREDRQTRHAGLHGESDAPAQRHGHRRSRRPAPPRRANCGRGEERRRLRRQCRAVPAPAART